MSALVCHTRRTRQKAISKTKFLAQITRTTLYNFHNMSSSKERRTTLLESLPWVEHPLISSAPMSGFATNELAVAVSQAGGLGQIGFTGSPGMLQRELEQAKQKLHGTSIFDETSKVLPVGVGIIAFGGPASPWTQTFAKYRPAMVWLSFGTDNEFKSWSENIRAVSPDTKVWIQVGSVKAALEAATSCAPDALVLQGCDAGGHGHKHGASIVTLIPEALDALHEQGLSSIPLIAAGGIMDKRSVAAAIALGASGVVMGTRFLACQEIEVADEVVDECLAARDGGEATVRSRVFDDIWGRNFWPDMYDGRCLRNAMYDNVEEGGMSIQEAHLALSTRNRGEGGSESVVRDSYTIWAGTGVGMLKKKEKAADIVKQIREETKSLIECMGGEI
jgi:nitronate monooxygenase